MPNMRTYPQKARERITGSKIITRLIKHVEGEIELTPAQVASARILLGKVLPDVKSIEVDINAQLKTVSYQRLTNEQLMAIAAKGFRPDAIEGEVAPAPKKLKAL